MYFKNKVCILNLLISILLGVLTGVAFFFCLLPGIAKLPLFVFLTGTFILVGFSFLLGLSRHSKCVCHYGRCVLIGSVLSIILSAIACILRIVAFNICFAILVALFVTAFFFTIFTFYAFLSCLLKENCYSCRE